MHTIGKRKNVSQLQSIDSQMANRGKASHYDTLKLLPNHELSYDSVVTKKNFSP